MTKMTPTIRASALASLAAYQDKASPMAGAGYNLMRYARRELLEPNTDVLTPEEARAEAELLARLPDLPEVGPLPDFYPFLRSARAGRYRLIAETDATEVSAAS